MLVFIQRWALKALIAIAILGGVALYSYEAGVHHEKGVEAVQVIKADNQVTKQNNALQATADKSASQVIIYRDRIVTKYKTITKDVVSYAKQNPNASDLLDPDFISLHDRAASANGENTIAGSARDANGGASGVAITKADAIRVITGNYQKYYLCRQQVIDWIDFYTAVKNKVNVETAKMLSDK
jgi:hypothetical protein